MVCDYVWVKGLKRQSRCVGGKLEAQTGKVEDLITCIYMDANMVEAGIGKQLIYMNL